MFDVGFWELLFIMTLALLVLGPEKLPGVISGLGRMLGRARAVARGLKLQIEREMAMNPAPTRSESPKRPSSPTTSESGPSSPTTSDGGSAGPTGDDGSGPPSEASGSQPEPAPAPGDTTEDERRSGA